MLRALMLALIGGGAFAAVYVATAPAPPPLPETPTKTASLRDPAPRELPPILFELRPLVADDAQEGGESVAPPVRDVTPANMTNAVIASAQQGEPAETTEPARKEAPATEASSRERLFNPLVESAGTISVDGRTIRLAGIVAPQVETRCGPANASWPCGRMARTALRRFIRGRAVECEVPHDGSAVPDPARCFVAGENIAEWLVAQGWAESDGETLGAVEKKARSAKLGLWSDGWPGGQPAEVAAGD